ncbi:MAG: serpin family protein [Steroidobacteraceae bacterium]
MKLRCIARGVTLGGLLSCAVIQGGCGGGSANSSDASSAPPAETPTTSQAVAVAQAQRDGTLVAPAIVTADNAFGLALFNELNQTNSGNMAISPTSVALALQMVYNGAAGTTQQGMSQALQLQGLTAPEVDIDNAALQASMIDPDPDVALLIANSLWMHLADNPVLASFTQANQTYYAAEIGDLAGAPDNVNNWIAGQTDGLITNLLPAADYALVDAVIVNALYFKGSWTTAFDPKLTAPTPFTLSNGAQVTAQMMNQTGPFGYYAESQFQALRIPYGQKGTMSLLILLPAAGANLSNLVGGLTADSIDSLIAELQITTLSVGLPKFTTTWHDTLIAPLSTLGMGVAFSRSAADFSGISATQQLYISDVEHETVVEVDEAGTTAAAATTVTVTPTIVMAPTATMIMNRPFFYAIRDDATHALLFIGMLVNPN